jgi:hypothetical protein
VASSGATVESNFFEYNGRGTCDHTNWNCRPHITVHSQYGEPITSTVIRNNFGFMSGAGCIYTRVSGISIYSNTFFQYGQNDDTPSGTIDNPTCLVDSPGSVTYTGNIMVSTNGQNPLDGGTYSGSFNMCLSGESCGTSALTYNATTTFVSTARDSADFLKINTSSNAYNAGTTIASVTTDFFGTARTAGTYDVGAHEYDPGGGDPDPEPDPTPTRMTLIRMRRR